MLWKDAASMRHAWGLATSWLHRFKAINATHQTLAFGREQREIGDRFLFRRLTSALAWTNNCEFHASADVLLIFFLALDQDGIASFAPSGFTSSSSASKRIENRCAFSVN